MTAGQPAPTTDVTLLTGGLIDADEARQNGLVSAERAVLVAAEPACLWRTLEETAGAAERKPGG